MPKKKAHRKISPTRKAVVPVIVHTRFVIFYVCAALLSFAFFFMQTREWYFFISGKERVDFANETGEYDLSDTVAYVNGEEISVPPPYAYTYNPTEGLNRVLGDTTSSNKRIEIDLTNQRVYAFEGSTKVYDFLVSTGLWGRTPTGEFDIWVKYRATKMSGGSKALGTYYYLPNVPYVMFFANAQVPRWKGYSFHGTYWHSNFGHPMSHGCINMKTEEAAILYYWAHPDLQGKQSITASADNLGTKVIIYGTAPAS
ncbi:MAG: L,D-transpeptidase [Candidatus Levybacteria bacterium]|nr:L,D-transpeptidase [Candidatus Levybacteria bacterium]